MSLELEQIIGPVTRTDGLTDGPVRVGRQGDAVVVDAHGRYHEATSRGQMFSLVLTATTTGVAAGNIVGAAAAAVTQFALLNPATSGKNYSLSKFCVGIISGTPGAGPLFHAYIPNIGTISVGSPGGAVRNNLPNASGSAAIPWSLAAGSALTGGQQPVTLRCADFSSTATAQASVGLVKTTDFIDGEIVIPPGFARWAFERMPASLGQKTKAASFPVAIASDQDTLSVSFGVAAQTVNGTLMLPVADSRTKSAVEEGNFLLKQLIALLDERLN